MALPVAPLEAPREDNEVALALLSPLVLPSPSLPLSVSLPHTETLKP